MLLTCVAACEPEAEAGRAVSAPESAAEGGAGSVGALHLGPLRVGEPQRIGALAGPEAPLDPATLELAGTDLGWTFEHRGRLTMLFGDTVPYPRYYCDEPAPFEDDTLATLPLAYPGDVPLLQFVTRRDAPLRPAPLRVLRDGAPLSMGSFKTPLTGFSDGENAFALFGRVEYTRCSSDCAAAGLVCTDSLGVCDSPDPFTRPCNPAAANSGCGTGRECRPAEPGFCIDRTAATFTAGGSEVGSIARDTELGLQRPDDPATFESVRTLRSKKFHNPTARTVRAFSRGLTGSDYAPGAGRLLVWGRTGFITPRGRGQLYLLTHALPLRVQGGEADWQPEYFAGTEAGTNVPRWTADPREAVPLALDGQIGGDPSEPVSMVGQMAISWLGPPIGKWVMLYAGGLDSGLRDSGRLSSPNAGAVLIRLADHPWGPWSPPHPHLSPGDITRPGSPSGPGGYLFNIACRDLPDRACARADRIHVIDEASGACSDPTTRREAGYFYGVNIIDPYTRISGGRATVYWNVSTWNPYGVSLLETTFEVAR